MVAVACRARPAGKRRERRSQTQELGDRALRMARALASVIRMRAQGVPVEPHASASCRFCQDSTRYGRTARGQANSVILSVSPAGLRTLGLSRGAGSQQVDPIPRGRDRLAPATVTATRSGQTRPVPKAIAAIPACGRFQHEAARPIAGDGLHDMGQMLFDLTFGEADQLGQLP